MTSPMLRNEIIDLVRQCPGLTETALVLRVGGHGWSSSQISSALSDLWRWGDIERKTVFIDDCTAYKWYPVTDPL